MPNGQSTFDADAYSSDGWRSALDDNYYARLGLDPNSQIQQSDITSAFEARHGWWVNRESQLKKGQAVPILKTVGPYVPQAIKNLAVAKNILMDPNSRAAYDQEQFGSRLKVWRETTLRQSVAKLSGRAPAEAVALLVGQGVGQGFREQDVREAVRAELERAGIPIQEGPPAPATPTPQQQWPLVPPATPSPQQHQFVYQKPGAPASPQPRPAGQGIPPLLTVLGLLFCAPVGLALMWLGNWSQKAKVVITSIYAGFLVLWLVGVSIASSVASNNTAGGGTAFEPRPAGASDAAVVAPIYGALQSCAKSATLNPVNCPQQDGSGGTGVIWTLHGSPAMQVAYDGGGKFTVDGHAVYTVRQDNQSSYGGYQYDLVKTHFDASLHWASGKSVLDGFNQANDYNDTNSEPRPAVLTDQAAEDAVKALISKCLTYTSGAWPVECPAPLDHSLGPDQNSTNITYRLGGDPLLNARVTYDSAWGLVHVVGTVVIQAAWDQQYETSGQSNQASGNYDAVVVDDGGKPVVLQVTTQ